MIYMRSNVVFCNICVVLFLYCLLFFSSNFSRRQCLLRGNKPWPNGSIKRRVSFHSILFKALKSRTTVTKWSVWVKKSFSYVRASSDCIGACSRGDWSIKALGSPAEAFKTRPLCFAEGHRWICMCWTQPPPLLTSFNLFHLSASAHRDLGCHGELGNYPKLSFFCHWDAWLIMCSTQTANVRLSGYRA